MNVTSEKKEKKKEKKRMNRFPSARVQEGKNRKGIQKNWVPLNVCSFDCIIGDIIHFQVIYHYFNVRSLVAHAANYSEKNTFRNSILQDEKKKKKEIMSLRRRLQNGSFTTLIK